MERLKYVILLVFIFELLETKAREFPLGSKCKFSSNLAKHNHILNDIPW